MLTSEGQAKGVGGLVDRPGVHHFVRVPLGELHQIGWLTCWSGVLMLLSV
jgi:hypothetical protein